METLTEKRTINDYVRTGRVRVEPIKRSSDWVLPESDSAFMNTGAKHEYVVPNSLRTGALIDPLADLTEAQIMEVTKQLGFKTADALNVNKPVKENYWINRPVILDRNGRYLQMSNVNDFIAYKILKSCSDDIAPSFEDRYNKGTYKFALVSEDEESKIKTSKVDLKKDAYILFGNKLDGSLKKMIDFLWIYYLEDKEGKRLPNNPSMEYCKGEIGRIVEEKTGTFMAIMTDPEFETKSLIQRAINCGLIHRDGMTFSVFGETSSRNNLEGLITYLKDARNNNIRLSLIGKIDAIENPAIKIIGKSDEIVETLIPKVDDDLLNRIAKIEDSSKLLLNKNEELSQDNAKLKEENDKLREILSSNTDPVKEKKVIRRRNPKSK
jgi:hypothetical protein